MQTQCRSRNLIFSCLAFLKNLLESRYLALQRFVVSMSLKILVGNLSVDVDFGLLYDEDVHFLQGVPIGEIQVY